MPETEIMKLAHELKAPSDELHLLPGVHSTLLSGVKFAYADYVTILDKEVINIYYGRTAKIIISENSVLSGYRTEKVLWRIPMKKNVQNVNNNTLLIQRPSTNKDISHVFELSSSDKTIAYYHTTTVFTTKETWNDGIRAGNYDTWQGLNVKAVNK